MGSTRAVKLAWDTKKYKSELNTYPVVRLRFADAAALGPVVLLAVGGRRQLLQLSGPEPAVDLVRQQVWAVAALEVTQTARGPNVFHLENENETQTLQSRH